MDNKYQCQLCLMSFSSLQRLESHLERKHKCDPTLNKEKFRTELKQPNICQYCLKTFARKDSLTEHIKKNRCVVLKNQLIVNKQNFPDLKEEMAQIKPQLNEKNKLIANKQNFSDLKDLKEEMAQIKHQLNEKSKEIEELKTKSANITNNLQIVCISSTDNYLDILTQQLGNFDKALEYIKDCALSEIMGDCKLIEKIYLSNDENKISSLYYVDKSRTKIQYYDEKKNKVIDNKESFGRKLANNLQNSYLKGVNHLLNNNLNNRLCPNKFLEEYDIQLWNQHIYELSNVIYQKKIINHLNIPIQSISAS